MNELLVSWLVPCAQAGNILHCQQPRKEHIDCLILNEDAGPANVGSSYTLIPAITLSFMAISGLGLAHSKDCLLLRSSASNPVLQHYSGTVSKLARGEQKVLCMSSEPLLPPLTHFRIWRIFLPGGRCAKS